MTLAKALTAREPVLPVSGLSSDTGQHWSRVSVDRKGHEEARRAHRSHLEAWWMALHS